MDDYELSTEVMFETPDPIQSPVPVELYSEIALSLALEGDMDAVALEAFLAKHDLTLQQYNTLINKQTFLRYLNEAKVLVSETGDKQGFKVRARFYAERLADSMYRLANNASTEPQIRLKIFETLSRLAELDPATQKRSATGESIGGSGGVIINIGANIRGLTAVDNTITVEMPE